MNVKLTLPVGIEGPLEVAEAELVVVVELLVLELLVVLPY